MLRRELCFSLSFLFIRGKSAHLFPPFKEEEEKKKKKKREMKEPWHNANSDAKVLFSLPSSMCSVDYSSLDERYRRAFQIKERGKKIKPH